MKRFVAYHEEYGVYLGSALGLGFWSRMDPAGQDAAPTFLTEACVRDYVRESSLRDGKNVRAIPIEADLEDGDYASMKACIRAGIPAWDPKGVESGS